LEYFDGTTALFIFRVDPEGITMHYAPKSEGYQENLNRFLQSIFNKPDRLSAAYQHFGVSAHQWYQTLVAPVIPDTTFPQMVLIAPDGLLSYLPFEVLLTQAPGNEQDFLNLPYLLQSSTCHYTYSAQLWLENKRVTGLMKSASTVLGMASDYSADQEFLPLPGASEEVVRLSTIYKDANLKVGSDASRSNFINLVEQQSWKTIHLAMHGVVDSLKDSKSRLAFTDKKHNNRNLYAYQIAGLDIQTPLVVLSACETGTGQLRRGEGVFSLARSFMSAGVPSVVMSLWSTNDQATKQIMGDFHQGLADGQSKAAALQSAKLAYLKNPADPIGHPAFWAPFVLIGDEVPLQRSGNRKFLIAALVMVSFLFLFTMGMLMARISHLKAQKKASSPKGNEA
ncbi:MAG: CHAT domain-containing protein, partial [Bacteroidota bacterium]